MTPDSPGNTSSGAISDEGTSYSAEGGEKGHGLPGPRLSLHGVSVLFQHSAWPSPPPQRTPLLRVYPLLRRSMNCATTQSGSPGSQEEDGPVAHKPARGSGVKRVPSTWQPAGTGWEPAQGPQHLWSNLPPLGGGKSRGPVSRPWDLGGTLTS